MVDYKDIGARIRAARKKKNYSQERLAEQVGTGVSHISHIETGSSIPSLPLLLNIINALECSADEILCIEVAKGRPEYIAWASEMFSDCSQQELKIISATIVAMKEAMRRLETVPDKQ